MLGHLTMAGRRLLWRRVCEADHIWTRMQRTAGAEHALKTRTPSPCPHGHERLHCRADLVCAPADFLAGEIPQQPEEATRLQYAPHPLLAVTMEVDADALVEAAKPCVSRRDAWTGAPGNLAVTAGADPSHVHMMGHGKRAYDEARPRLRLSARERRPCCCRPCLDAFAPCHDRRGGVRRRGVRFR